MSSLPKVKYILNAISIKFPVRSVYVCVEPEKPIPKFIGKNQMPKISKIHFKNKTGVFLLASINNIEPHTMTNSTEESLYMNPAHRNLFYDSSHYLSVQKGQNFS